MGNPSIAPARQWNRQTNVQNQLVPPTPPSLHLQGVRREISKARTAPEEGSKAKDEPVQPLVAPLVALGR